MNKQQRNYVLAKAHYDAINIEMSENETLFLREKGVVNPDGSIPDCFAAVEPDSLIETLLDEFENHPLNKWEDAHKAEQVLEQAEDDLIDYAIRISPAGIRDALRHGAKIFRYRQKLIDLALRLDTRTVPRHV